jgi:hypothetical protein
LERNFSDDYMKSTRYVKIILGLRIGYASGPADIRYAVPAAGMFLWFEMLEGFNAGRGMQTDGTDPQK